MVNKLETIKAMITVVSMARKTHLAEIFDPNVSPEEYELRLRSIQLVETLIELERTKLDRIRSMASVSLADIDLPTGRS
jgi:hypothetical protein